MQPVRQVESLATPTPRESTLSSSEDENRLDLEEFLAIIRRRKAAFLIPMLIIFSVSVVIAWSLPKLYKSTATILIEQQEIPDTFVRSTVQTYAAQRIQTITQRVLTTANLKKIISKFDLISARSENEPLDVIVNQVRRNFSVQQMSAGRGRQRGTIAFNVSYVDRSPDVAQAVATELSGLYLEENIKTRMESAADTTGFLLEEAERLGSEISELETQIAVFKRTHMGRLPQQLGMNLQLMGRAEEQMQSVENRIRSLEDRKIYLENAMAQIQASPQGGPNQIAVQVRTLRAQLRGMLAIYTPDHPDVTRLRTEIAALENQMSDEGRLSLLRSELEDRKAELSQLLKKSSPGDPDVTNLQQQVANLETALGGMEVGDNATSPGPSAGWNFIDRQAQYRAVENEIAALQSERNELQNKLVIYEKRIEQTPEIERQLSLLQRDRDNVLRKYQDIKAKLSNARVAENLEKASKGERFSLIEPANRPSTPFKPNRKKILGLGLFGSVGAGIATVVLLEFLQKAVYGVNGVIALLGTPPLAVIPYVNNARDRRRRFGRRVAIAISLLAMLTIAVVAFHLKVMPLDDVVTKYLTKLEAWWLVLKDWLGTLSMALNAITNSN